MRISLVFILLCLIACSQTKEESLNVFPKFERLISSQHRSIAPNYDYLIDYIDSVLIVLNFQGTNSVALYNRYSFEPIVQGVTFGKGPNEVLSPTFLFTDKKEKKFYILDNPGKKFLDFSMDSVLGNSNFIPLESIRLPSNGGFNFPVFPADERTYLAINWMQNGHFVSFDKKGEILRESGSFPVEPLPENIPDIMAGALYEGRYDINKDRDRIYKTYLNFDRIAIFDIEGNELKSLQTGLTEYDNVRYENGRLIIRERQFCYVSAYVSDQFFYALYHGGPAQDSPDVLGNEIHVFDHEGKAVKRLLLDIPTSDIAVDEAEGIIYGINFTLDNPIIVYEGI